MDRMSIKILEEGTIRTEIAGSVSAPNHQNAEAFLKEFALLTGGPVTRQRRGIPGHVHGHSHAHGGGHSHE